MISILTLFEAEEYLQVKFRETSDSEVWVTEDLLFTIYLKLVKLKLDLILQPPAASTSLRPTINWQYLHAEIFL